MNREKFADALLEVAYSKGIESAEIYMQENEKTSIKVYEENVDKYEKSKTGGLSLRVFHNEQIGYSYTENFDEENVAKLIDLALENSDILEREDLETMYQGSSSYQKGEEKGQEMGNVLIGKKIEDLYEMERLIKREYSQIHTISHLSYGEITQNLFIKNTEGLSLSYKNTFGYHTMQTVSKGEKDNYSFYNYQIFSDYMSADPIAFAKKTASECIEKIGAGKIPSGKYQVVLDGTCACDLLSAFLSNFSAEAVDKKISYLQGKVGQQIGDSSLQIVDDPFWETAFINRNFDDEGVATLRKSIVKDGVLESFLHNRKTANKFGVKNTANAAKAGYKGTIGISHSNFLIQPGQPKLAELLEGNRVLYIKELEGLHAGINVVTGDFSLSAQGLLFEQGKMIQPVQQITVAGNYFEMLHQIEGIGNQLEFSFPGQLGSVAAPSLRIKELQVSGD